MDNEKRIRKLILEYRWEMYFISILWALEIFVSKISERGVTFGGEVLIPVAIWTIVNFIKLIDGDDKDEE